MPLDKLLKRIEKDAVQEAEKIKKKADKQAVVMVDQEQALLKEQRSKELEAAYTQAKARQGAILASAKLEARDTLLKAKREELDKAFRLAFNKLNKLEGQSYREALSKLKDRYSTGGERVIEPKEKGLILVDENGAQIDLTFNNLVDYYKDELEQEVYEILLGS